MFTKEGIQRFKFDKSYFPVGQLLLTSKNIDVAQYHEINKDDSRSSRSCKYYVAVPKYQYSYFFRRYLDI